MLDVKHSQQPISIMTAVNFCELKISQNPAETLVAFSIGSGIFAYEDRINAIKKFLELVGK